MGRAIALSLAVWLVAGAAGAQETGSTPARSDADVARRAHSFSQQVMSPYCPGRTLADCPSPDALAVREQVRELLREGVSEATIRSQLSARYGDAIEGTPRSTFGWALPVGVLAAGVAVLLWVLRSLSGRAPAPAGKTGFRAAPGELESELEAELRSRGL